MKKFVTVFLMTVACGVFADDATVPDRYLEYVESTGEQFVDLGVTAGGHVEVEAVIAFTEDAPGDVTVVGARKDDGNTRYYLVHNTGGIFSHGYGAFGYTSLKPAQNRIRVVADFGPGAQSQRVDGVTVWSDTSEDSIDTGLNLYLFACNNKGSPYYFAKVRVYSLKLWKEGVLVRNLRPCVKNGKAGLHDVVSNTILHGGVRGGVEHELVAGPDCRPRERPDALLEYLESTGAQYVDLDVTGHSGMSSEVDLAFKAHGDVTLLGAYAGSNRFYLLHNYTGKPSLGYGWRLEPFGGDFLYTLNERYVVRTDLTGGEQKLSIEGGASLSFTTNDVKEISTARNIYLFACNDGGTARYFATARVYGLKLWQDGELVRDLHPCLKNGRAGFFDAVEGRTYFASGATDFTPACCGPVTNIVENARPDHFIEYVASDGTPGAVYFDTGVRAESGLRMETEMAWESVPGDGSYLAARNVNLRFYLYHHYQGHMLGYDAYVPYQTMVTATAGTRYRVCSVLKDGVQSIDVDRLEDGAWTDEATLSKTTAGTVDTQLNLYLFACNKKDEGPVYGARSRCYKLRLWKDDVLVRDYVPVSFAGVPMLWDRVSERLCPASGAKHFVGGPLGDPFRYGTTVIFR